MLNEQSFRQDWAELLAKYNAECVVTDDGKPYGQHSGICIIYIPSIWKDDKLLQDYCEFNL